MSNDQTERDDQRDEQTNHDRAVRQILRRPAPIRVSRWAGATNDPATIAHLYA